MGTYRSQLLALIAILGGGCARHEFAFHSLFTGGAVLQQGVEVSVWGTAPFISESLQLSLDGIRVADAIVANNGTWLARLPPRDVAWHSVLTVSHLGGDVVETVVSFGVVILCSGQSNMGMPLSNPGGFTSENGTAEAAAAGRYTGKMWLVTAQMQGGPKVWNGTGCGQRSPPGCVNHLEWNNANPATVAKFSAVCWYAGRSLFDRLKGKVPIGLIKGSVGGSPIEFWLPPGHVNDSTCGVDKPACDPKKIDSAFYGLYIEPFVPYTLGAVVWDQGERDVHCFYPATNETNRYPCMERELIKSWRQLFRSSFSFVAVQLPGYLGDCDSTFANPNSSYFNCVPGVFEMRLAQEAGTTGVTQASVVATYDLSCPFGTTNKQPQCPFGTVHNVRKAPVGERVGAMLQKLIFPKVDIVSEGPRATRVIATPARAARETSVLVHFDGGSQPFYLKGTLHCAACCEPASHSFGDFDASADGGTTWVNATGPPSLALDGAGVTFIVPLSKVTHVRYTANQGFPQCAVYNQEGFPALPFIMKSRQEEALLQV
eukprot:TRINITY_DN12290_c0_g1_i1.p1 TRINITY_DN12290_c0_g1~~TRINITY_DN12290_c0_g1_i1.p1  ORF type:complete len:544 (+),score=69.68 TRINITY_DN12290_c0_g1_i1:84-1715(+)